MNGIRVVTLHKGFEGVKRTMERIIEKRWDGGAGSSFCAHINDVPVVELYTGDVTLSNSNVSLPLLPSHLQLVASTSKAITSIATALLVDRNLIKYSDPISKHWPEFANKNKGDVTIRDLLMHRSGLAYLSGKLTPNLLIDQDLLSTFLADQPLNWIPQRGKEERKEQAYHAISQGLFLSQICRRVDPQRRTIGRFITEEICNPLHITFHFGFPIHQQENVVAIKQEKIDKIIDQLNDPNIKSDSPPYNLTDYEIKFYLDLFGNSLSYPHRTLLSWLHIDQQSTDQSGAVDPKLLTAELPSSNGHTNAYGLGVLAAMINNKGVYRGKKIFSNPDILDEMLQLDADSTYDVDKVLNKKVPFTQSGFALLPSYKNEDDIFNCRHIEDVETNKEKVYGWGGAGGSLFRIIPELNLSCCFIPTFTGLRMAMNDPRATSLLSSLIHSARNL